MKRFLLLAMVFAIACASGCRAPEKRSPPESAVDAKRAIEIAKQVFEHYSLDPLSWYQIEVSADDGAADWCVIFDGTSHASQPGSWMKVVLVNKKAGRAAYMPGYSVLKHFESP